MANPITILSLFIFSCFALLSPTIYSSNETDLISLLSFKNEVNDPYGALNSWNETAHFCSWNGIRCGRRHPNRVVTINLSSQSLMGQLSPHIGNLSFLRSIDLQNNSFSGEIPYEIGRLRRLESVDFSNNSFVGFIPRNISQCPNLSYLNLIDNILSGTIPQELSYLHKLEALGLSLNKFSGPIPPLLGNLTSLEVLSLGVCDLTGEIPQSLVQLHSLTLLNLAENNLIGIVPSGLFNISGLTAFSINDNQLQGSIPDSIGLTLPNLSWLQLGYNQLAGAIPTSLSNASSLEIIQLSHNFFTGPIPRFGKLSVFLHFGGIRKPTIHGEIPSGIGNLIGLIRLGLYDNNLEGPLPWDMGKLSNLQQVHLGGNKFTKELPSSLGNMTLLNILYLQGNYFSGNLPQSLSNCTNLLDLDLSRNNFSGLIPREITRLSSISISFNLSFNAFIGSIPTEIGSLTNLQILDLSNNRLTGLIPNSLGNCLVLQQLFLKGNLLQGEIPLGLHALKGLVDLDLSRNNLSGTIPSFLTELHLQNLNLSHNRFQGEVPKLGLFKNRTAFSLDGNNLLCGGIPELNLPPCSVMTSSKKNSSSLLKILIPAMVSGGVLFICLVYFVMFLCRRGRSRKNVASLESTIGTQVTRISYGDLVKATNGFSKANLILDSKGTKIAVKVRLNIAIDVAHSLEYLHFGTDSTIVHGDLKPSNILLDHNMIAYVGDFGLAKIVSSMFPAQESSSSIGIRGTVGYVAPEYGTSNLVSTQGDVYSYGFFFWRYLQIEDQQMIHSRNMKVFISLALPCKMT
ncbi:UNVERIFIED_CONTAM: putative LRR receptor-like serine/threonine-protein kinase [Sesamum calycinum]|uniref:non-specific serine/threonine protein kinase n=1 Tax=Sesamum calycinum TaxID=2727403 RepID=A0AAW2RAJ2_9LAMI